MKYSFFYYSQPKIVPSAKILKHDLVAQMKMSRINYILTCLSKTGGVSQCVIGCIVSSSSTLNSKCGYLWLQDGNIMPAKVPASHKAPHNRMVGVAERSHLLRPQEWKGQTEPFQLWTGCDCPLLLMLLDLSTI